MTAIAGERIEKAQSPALTKARLKGLAYAALGGVIALLGARYGYEPSAASSRAPTTPMPETTSRRYRRMWPGSSRRSWLATMTMCAPDSR